MVKRLLPCIDLNSRWPRWWGVDTSRIGLASQNIIEHVLAMKDILLSVKDIISSATTLCKT